MRCFVISMHLFIAILSLFNGYRCSDQDKTVMMKSGYFQFRYYILDKYFCLFISRSLLRHFWTVIQNCNITIILIFWLFHLHIQLRSFSAASHPTLIPVRFHFPLTVRYFIYVMYCGLSILLKNCDLLSFIVIAVIIVTTGPITE